MRHDLCYAGEGDLGSPTDPPTRIDNRRKEKKEEKEGEGKGESKRNKTEYKQSQRQDKGKGGNIRIHTAAHNNTVDHTITHINTVARSSIR